MILQIQNLCKSFGSLKAVDDLSFSVRSGELFAFLGVNGAGKSTTINIISGILDKDGGKVEVCDCDIDLKPDTIKSKIGIVFQNSVLDKRLTVMDNLKSRAALYGIRGENFKARICELDKLLGLNELLPRTLNKLSGGQRRRIDIARALLHSPELLILDEPTTGLDPQTRISVWNAIEKLRHERGLTVLLTTHYMEEATVADNVLILDSGKKVVEGTPHELKNKFATDCIRFYKNLDEAKKVFDALGLNIRAERDFVEVEVGNTSDVIRYMRSYPNVFDDFEVLKGNMDNVFLKVTGKNIKEA